MTNTTTQSGQRPPVANRPTDAELAHLLRAAAGDLEYCETAMDFQPDNPEIVNHLLAASEALDASTPRLTPAEWSEAVQRARLELEGYDPEEEILTVVYELGIPDILRAAFPHLAPNPED